MNTIKKPISVLLVFAVAVIPLSCKSLDPKLLEQTAAFDSCVAPMRVVVNTDSIKACFPGGWLDHNGMIAVLDRRVEEISRGKTGLEPQHFPCCSFSGQESAVKIIRNNLMFDRDSRTVYLSVLVRKVEWEKNGLWIPLGPITAGLFYFFGGPSFSLTMTIDMEAAVMRPDGRVLKTYTAKVSNTEYRALYWGYDNPEKPSYVKALISACADIRKQIENDKENINKMIR